MALDVIQGQKFRDMADFTFSPEKKLLGDYDNLPNTFRPLALKEKRIYIVYTHTMYVGSLFDLLRELPLYKFVVVCHNSDNCIEATDTNIFFTHDGFGQNLDWFDFPHNVIKLFVKNVDVFDKRVEAIPIGLENDMWFPEINKKKKIEEKVNEPHQWKNLVYMNFNINTNPRKRQACYDYFKDFPWVTVDMKANGSDFDSYLDNLYNHKFVLCPEGNGMDTHRTWETLYLGNIPIELGNNNNRFWSDLRMVLPRQWEDVTVEYLAKELQRLREIESDMNQLKFQYWKDKILSYANPK